MCRYLLAPPVCVFLLCCCILRSHSLLLCAKLCCAGLQGGGISVRRQLVEEASGHHLLLHTGQLEALTCPAAILHRYCRMQLSLPPAVHVACACWCCCRVRCFQNRPYCPSYQLPAPAACGTMRCR